jgi:hypothetical protein
MLFSLRLSFLCLTLASGVVGCVSGSIKRVNVSNELPTDLPKEIKERFEVKESASAFRAVSAEIVAPASSLNKQKSKKKGKTGKVTAKASFVYPYRRPEKEPLWIGERLTYSISYFGVSAGDFTLEVMPHKEIGGRKVYHLRGNAVSSAVFSLFYRLNDVVESFVDYEGFFSHRFHVVLDETKQKRDALELNDSEKKQTYYWNRWDRKKEGYVETKEFGPIEAFSQDSMSALYYVRTIPLPTGSVATFPVVSEGKTWEAVCTVVRREVVSSPLGDVQAIVIRPEMKYQGILKKTGDSFLWLTDDDRRIPIRLDAKVRIGTVSAVLKKVDLGTPPNSMALLPVVAPSPNP